MSQDGTFAVPVSPQHPSNGHPSWCDPTHCTTSRLGPESNPEPDFESNPQGMHQSAPAIIPADPPVETVAELHLASLTTMRGISPQTLLILDLGQASDLDLEHASDLDLEHASDLDLEHAPDVDLDLDLGRVDLDHSDMGPDLSSEVALRSDYATFPGTNPGNAPKTYPLTLHQARTLHEALGKFLTSVGEPPSPKAEPAFGAANRT